MSNTSLCRYCNYLSDGEYLCDPSGPDVCTPCQRLFELEERVKEIRMMLVGIESERQKLKEQANHHHERMIHRLPPEIASEVFELCIPDDLMGVDLERIPSRYTICFPLVLSAVCRKWRDIAHSTPPLWKTLPLVSRISKPRSLPGPLFVKDWLDRAGQLPLSIILCIPSSPIYGPATTIINTIKQYSNRWLELRCDGSYLDIECISNVDEDLPQLRRLRLTTPGEYRPPRLKLQPTQLKRLSISGNLLGSVDFSWSHLTQLTVEDVTPSECVEALRRAPHLKKCTFKWERDSDSDAGDDSFPLPLTPIVHAELQELEILSLLYKDVLEHLLCPSLKILTLDAEEHTEVEMPLIVEFLNASGCSLESFSLLQTEMSTSDITILCEEIPTLHHLHIQRLPSSVMKSLLVYLAEFSTVDGKTEPRYLPDLLSLHIETTPIHVKTTFDWSLLPDIFSYCTAHPADRRRHALESVTIDIDSSISIPGSVDQDSIHIFDDDTLMWILRLREAGVKWKVRLAIGRAKTVDVLALDIDHYGIDINTVEY